MKKIIVGILAALTLGIAEGQITWQKKNGPYGGDIKNIIVHSSGTAYALGEDPNRTIWRSTDNGDTWIEHAPSVFADDQNRIEQIKLAPDGSIYALGYSDLYRTADNGTTWTKLNSVSGSDNGGFDQGFEIAINPLSGVIYVMGYHYPDAEWTVFRSGNGGSTWTKGYQGQYFTQLISNSIGDVYGLAGGTQLWRSSDNAGTFAQLSTPVPTDVSSGTIHITAKSNGTEIAVVTSSSAIYTLTSPSTTWVGPITETGIVDAAYATNARLLYTADNSMLFLFDNQNNKVYSRTTGNWTAKATGFVTAGGDDVKCAASLSNNNLFAGTQRIGIYKSINSGLGWSEANVGIENHSMRNMVVADNGAIIVAGSAVYRSTDEGASWTKFAAACCSYYSVMKATTGTPKTILLLAENGGVSYKSVDNGANWTTIANTPNAKNFASPDGTKIIAYNSNQLFYSGNQGTSWSAALTLSGFPGSFGFTAYNDNSLAMDQNNIVYSALYDYGASSVKFYKIVLSPATPTTATATQIAFGTMGMGNFVDGVKFLNNKIYVFGDPVSGSNSVITSTANAGVNWTAKTSPQGFRMDVDPINNYLFVTRNSSSNYTVNISRDDGTTFSPTTIALSSNNTHPYGIALNSNGIAFAGFNGSSVHKTSSTVVTPVAPTSLVSTGSSTNRITLQWNDNATNEEYYIIEKFNGSTFDSLTRTFSFSGNGKGFVELQNLQPNTSYQFRVYAENSAGTSTTISITTSTLESCVSDIPDNKSWTGTVNATALTNVVVKKISDGVYSISDVNNGVATGVGTVVPAVFDVACAAGSPKTYIRSDYPFYSNTNGTWTTGTSTLVLRWTTDPGVTPSASGLVTLVKNVNDPIPTAPTGVAAYNYSNTSIEVKWQSVAFEKKFFIERKTGAGGTYAQVGEVLYPNTSFVDATAGLTFGNTYFYRVKSENGNASPQQSAYSTEAQILFKKPNFVVAQTLVNSTPYNSLGSVWSDFNNDGFDDLLLTSFDLFSGQATAPLVFQNNGSGNFTLATSNLDAVSYANATAADYDNDGDIDIFYSTFSPSNRLYSGNGTFSFTKITPSVVEDQPGADFDDGAPFSASWLDYDNDGLLDLFVARTGDVPAGLYKQNADHSFTKITTAGDLVTTVVGGFASAWADYDNDGDKDVFMIDQFNGQANKLFRNNGDGTFTKVTGSAFEADANLDPQAASWADFDNDQDMDLFVGGEDGVNMLYRNNGNGTFTKLTTAAFDVTTTSVLGSNWADVNNDGFIDLFAIGGEGSTTLFLNNNGTSFTRNNTEKISDGFFQLAAPTSDFDNDGFVDLFLVSTAAAGDDDVGATPAQNAVLMKNNNTTGNWLKIKLVGTTSNKSAIGAKIRITTGAQNQIREVNSHIGIASQNSLTQHFGLGAATKADNLVVTWPTGLTQTLVNVNANATVTIIEDASGPAIATRTPAVSATNVPANTTISFTLNESSTPQSGKLLMLYLNTDLSTPILGIDVTAAVKAGDTYTFTLPSDLQTATKYNISVDAGAFKDIYGNSSLEFPTGLWSFTVAGGPLATVFSPAHNASDIAANTALQITFDKNVTAVSGKRLKIMDGATAVVDIDVATTGTVTNAIYQFTPSVKLPTNKVLKITVDGGAFKDAATQANFAGIAINEWTFTTAPGPVATAFSPENNATNIATNTALQITFDKNVTAVAGKKLKVMDGTTAIVDVDVATSGTVTNNVYSLTPSVALPSDKLLKVVVDANAFIDFSKQTDFAGIAADVWTFRTALAADATAPIIAFVPPLTAAKGFNNLISPEVTVTDDRGTVSSVVITIKKISAAASTAVDVPAIQGTGANINKWVFTISESNHFDAAGTEYFITAKDPSNNTVRNPATGTHKLYLTYTANESKIPSDKLGFGGAVTNWKVFSIPFDLGVNNSFTTVFNELEGKTNKVDYRFLTIQPNSNTNWTEYPSFTTITRGQGYFSNIKAPVDILLGPLQAPENTRTNLFTLNLKAGWNMIGNPYLTQISWANVKDLNGLTGQVAELHKFNGTNYPVGVQTLDPYEGGFVFAQADRTVTIPFLGQTASGGRAGYHELPGDINGPEWLMYLNVKQGDVLNDLGSIGMAPDAKLSLDDYDGVTPPRFIEFLETNFAHAEHFAKRFTRDVVPTQNEYTWHFSVDTNLEGEAEIFWDNSAFANGAKEIFLYDENRQRLIDMRAVSRYSFNPKESVNFKVYFGDNLKIAPESVLLGKAFPNPTSGITNIAFSLPDSGGQSQFVTLDILDATGRTMGTIAQGRYQPGFYETGFNAKEFNNGFYTYRLTVQNSRGRNTVVNKLIIK